MGKASYMVMVLNYWANLAAEPWRVNPEALAPHCVGFAPIFDDVEAAVQWRDQWHPSAEIVAVASEEGTGAGHV